eukprot:TRINITY_DN425_c0_g2_i6.p1 TRINITY_DN425_c0_g2~~TRINITY_DN425_c0_g2_i6.p1  ORF type:complete len:533 (-),score=100.88 TRINITY_DN425_c0_g2_i6:475-2073(-)
MAYTAHPTQERIQEQFDDEICIIKKAKLTSELIKRSKYVTFFTGAGFSTSAGIPDYRGPEGVWTIGKYGGKRLSPYVDPIKATPTKGHMSLVELQNQGILKHVLSQNIDGLHRKSGILSQNISELHGNTLLEKCPICEKEYLRDFNVSSTSPYAKVHTTGRKCTRPGCDGDLQDSIINFGEDLNEFVLSKAWSETRKSDLIIVLGSSLTVRPACDMPRCLGKDPNKHLIICNLQWTPLDGLATLKVHSRSDVFMELVLKELGFTVPEFILSRYLQVSRIRPNTVAFTGLDTDRTPVTFLNAIEHIKPDGLVVLYEEEPFHLQVEEKTEEIAIRLHFMGHYNEPPLDITLKIPPPSPPSSSTPSTLSVCLDYNPCCGKWTFSVLDKSQEERIFTSFVKNGREIDGGSLGGYGTLGGGNVAITADSGSGAGVDVEEASFFAVYPRIDCPHVTKHVLQKELLEVGSRYPGNGCCLCGQKKENWYCLECGSIFCGRYVNAHGIAHYKEAGHPILLSFSDLSFWCYECDGYVANKVH